MRERRKHVLGGTVLRLFEPCAIASGMWASADV